MTWIRLPTGGGSRANGQCKIMHMKSGQDAPHLTDRQKWIEQNFGFLSTHWTQLFLKRVPANQPVKPQRRISPQSSLKIFKSRLLDLQGISTQRQVATRTTEFTPPCHLHHVWSHCHFHTVITNIAANANSAAVLTTANISASAHVTQTSDTVDTTAHATACDTAL